MGRIDRWSGIGGPERPITVVNKAEGRSTLDLFLAHFGLRNSEVKPDVVIGDNAQGLKTVAGNPWSIGYASIGSAEPPDKAAQSRGPRARAGAGPHVHRVRPFGGRARDRSSRRPDEG